MSAGIVGAAQALRHAIARSGQSAEGVRPMLAAVRALRQAIAAEYNAVPMALLLVDNAVSLVVTRASAADAALTTLDAFEEGWLRGAYAAELAPAPVPLRRVRHLAVFEGGRAA